MANHRPEIETIECDKQKNLSCAILGKPKALVFPGKVQFDVGFLVPNLKVNSADQALRILRMIPSWTSMGNKQINEVLEKIKEWKFPYPIKQYNRNELVFRYGLQHFYKHCCISDGASKLLYDDKYFDDLMAYLSEDGYLSGVLMWLPPALICETLKFIQSYRDDIDELPASADGAGTSSQSGHNVTYALANLKSEKENVNYDEAKTIVSVFIKELLQVESGIKESVLQFFTNNWLNNLFRGCYQFTSHEAFCIFFNNVAIFDSCHHLMFLVPNIRNAFVKRLLIPRKRLELDESFGHNPRSTVPFIYNDESEDKLTSVIERLCGFRLAGKSHDADARAMKSLSSTSSLIVRMCPDSSTDSRIFNRLKTIGEISGNGGNRRPVGYDTQLFGSQQRRNGGHSQYTDDEFDDDAESDGGMARVKCEATVRNSKRGRYKN